MFVRTFCFFSFRRFFFIFSLALFRISLLPLALASSTRAFSLDFASSFIESFFSLLISSFLSHTRTLSPSVSCLTQLMQNVPTQSDECVCVYVFLVIFSFNQSSRSHFARRFPHFFPSFLLEIRSRFLFFLNLLKSLHVLTHSLTLVNWLGGGGTGGGGWIGCVRDIRWRWSGQGGNGIYPRDLYRT